MARFQRQTVRHVPRIYGDLQKPKRDWRKLRRFLRILLVLLLGYCLYYFLFESRMFAVETVEVQGAQVAEPSAIQALVPLGGNIWRFPEDDVSRSIKESQPVLTVQVLKGIPRTVRVVVTERTPVIRWQSGETIYLLDSDGIAFMQYPVAQPPSPETSFGLLLQQVPLVNDSKRLPVAIGDAVVSRLFEEFVGSASSAMRSYLSVYTVEYIEIGDSSYDITMVVSGGMRVFMSSLADPGVQVRNLARLQRDGKLKPDSQVDLRIDRWAYVR
mgnify:CR=1 FL=1